MSTHQVHDFGRVDEKGDVFEFVIEPAGKCVLVAVVQTERGPRRTEIAGVPSVIWSAVVSAAVKELSAEMAADERDKNPPTFRAGLNRLSPLVGRELGVLLIVLMEEGAANRVDALLHAWRELAREEVAILRRARQFFQAAPDTLFRRLFQLRLDLHQVEGVPVFWITLHRK